MTEETYRLSKKIKLLWSMEYILVLLVLWIIFSVIYLNFFQDKSFLIFMPELPIVSVFLLLLVLILIIGVPGYFWVRLAYKNFTYSFDAHKVLIKMGVIHKKRINIPFKSIENISVERPLYERIFGLGTIALDTAGGNEKEGVIPGIEDTEGVMKDILSRMRDEKKQETEEKCKDEQKEDIAPILKDILIELRNMNDILKSKDLKKDHALLDVKEFEENLKKQKRKKR